jgi:NAD-dependent deacetylase
MVRAIVPGREEDHLAEAVAAFRRAQGAAALTGAGISVESGVPDFRSPGGVWTKFAPEEYATLDVFLRNPAKAWRLYRALGRTLEGSEPNPAHIALAKLETAGKLQQVVTQNVDGLHQAAGSQRVIEMHGDHQHLHCLQCDWIGPVRPELSDESVDYPTCPECDSALKPNVVLFGEDVRGMAATTEALAGCDVLLVIGTSAQVYPAAGLPLLVKEHGGLIFEFNVEETALTQGTTGGGWFGLPLPGMGRGVQTDFFFCGRASETLSLFTEAVLGPE